MDDVAAEASLQAIRSPNDQEITSFIRSLRGNRIRKIGAIQAFVENNPISLSAFHKILEEAPLWRMDGVRRFFRNIRRGGAITPAEEPVEVDFWQSIRRLPDILNKSDPMRSLRLRVALVFLEKGIVSIEEFKPIFNAANDWDKLTIAQSFLKNPKNTNIESLEEILGLFSHQGSRIKIAQSFFKNTGNVSATIDDLERIMELFTMGSTKDGDQKLPIAQSFFENTTNASATIDNLERIMGLFTDSRQKLLIAQSFFENTTNASATIDNLERIMGLFTDRRQKLPIAQSFFENTTNASATIGGLKRIMKLFEFESEKSSIAQSFYKNTGNASTTIDDLERIMRLFKDEDEMSSIAQSFFENTANASATIDNLERIMGLFTDRRQKLLIARSFCKNTSNASTTIDGLERIMGLFASEGKRSSIAQSFFENTRNASATIGGLKRIMKLIANYDRKSSIAQSFFENTANASATIDNLERIMGLITDRRQKLPIAQSFFENTSNISATIGNLERVMRLFEFEREKSSIAQSFFKNTSNISVTIDNLERIMGLFTDYDQKSLIANCFFRNLAVAVNLQDFKRIAKSMTQEDQVIMIGAIFFDMDSTKIASLVKEYLRYPHLIQDALRQIVTSSLTPPERIKTIQNTREILKTIDDDYYTLEIINNLVRKLSLSNIESLDLIYGKTKPLYKTLGQVLNYNISEESFSPEGWIYLKRKFGEKIIDPKYKLSDLLSYFDIMKRDGGIGDFMSILNPAFKGQLESNFRLPNRPFFLKEEIDKLKVIVGEEKFRVLENQKISLLAQYLQDKKIELPPLGSQEEIAEYKINFAECDGISKGDQLKANAKFINFLTKQNTDQGDVLSFISFIKGKDFVATISEFNESKLTRLFSDKKTDLAGLFQKKGGLQDFILELPSMVDGCGANIGNKTDILITSRKFESKTDALLYCGFINHVFFPIANSGGDLIGSNHNPLTHPFLRNSFLNIEPFITKLAEDIAGSANLKEDVQYESYATLHTRLAELIDRLNEAKVDSSKEADVDSIKGEINNIILEACDILEDTAGYQIGEPFAKLEQFTAAHVFKGFLGDRWFDDATKGSAAVFASALNEAFAELDKEMVAGREEGDAVRAITPSSSPDLQDNVVRLDGDDNERGAHK